MSPGGSRFPRTPANVAAYEKSKGSNEKPEKVKDAVKTKVEVDVEVAELREKLKRKLEDEDELKAEVDVYHEKMREMQEQLQMMEELVEDNEQRHGAELEAEREQRRELEARIDKRDDGRARGTDALKVRELELREKEYDLAEKRYDEKKAVDDDNASADADAFKCCLAISNPAGDVLCDLSMMRPLDDHLKNEKRSVTTVAGLLADSMEKSSELRKILLNSEQYSVKFVLQRFENKFKSLHKISSTSLSVVKILVMDQMNPVKTKAAVKYAGCRFKRELIRDIPSATKSGSVPVLESEFKLLVLSDLPGIAELLSTRDKAVVEDHWKALEDFIAGVVCHVKDVRTKLDDATAVLDAFCGKSMVDADTMLAEFNGLFDVCSSWLGAEMEGDFKKIQRFLKKCPQSVQAEYAEYISPKYNGERINELTMEWTEFEGIIQTVWEASSVKAAVRFGLGLGRSEENKEEQWMTVPRNVYDGRQKPAAAPGRSGIVCRDCKVSFVPSMKQAEKNELSDVPLPDTCPKCKGQVCDKFRENNGECPFGDGCKFLHPVELLKGGKPTDDMIDGPKKHSYSCRFFAAGHCMSGDQCRFQHGPPKAGAVMNISEVEPVFQISEVPKDESLALEVYGSRFHKFGGVDTSEYQYV